MDAYLKHIANWGLWPWPFGSTEKADHQNGSQP